MSMHVLLSQSSMKKLYIKVMNGIYQIIFGLSCLFSLFHLICLLFVDLQSMVEISLKENKNEFTTLFRSLNCFKKFKIAICKNVNLCETFFFRQKVSHNSFYLYTIFCALHVLCL